MIIVNELPFTSLSDTALKKQKAEILSQPVVDIDVSKGNTLAKLLDGFQEMSIQARNLGDCADVFERMLKDPERPTILLGLAGPLIAAGLRKVIRDMIAYGLVDVVVSTGAILYQDLYHFFPTLCGRYRARFGFQLHLHFRRFFCWV